MRNTVNVTPSTPSIEDAITRLYVAVRNLQPTNWVDLERAFIGFFVDMGVEVEGKFEGEILQSLKVAIINYRTAVFGRSSDFIFDIHDTMETMLNLTDEYLVAHREEGETEAIRIVAAEAQGCIAEIAEGNGLWISWFDGKGEYKPANYFRDARAAKESKAAETKPKPPEPPKPPQEPPQGGSLPMWSISRPDGNVTRSAGQQPQPLPWPSAFPC